MEYNRIFTPEEIEILNHDLLDITDWINKAIEGKINSCQKRAAIQYRQYASKEELPMIPVSDQACANELFKLQTYKNRQIREESILKGE